MRLDPEQDVIRVECSSFYGNIKLYRVYGLNIFVENSNASDMDKHNISNPYEIFYQSIMTNYPVVMLLGYPAIPNTLHSAKGWLNKVVYWQRITKLTSPHRNVKISLYSGDFYDGHKMYGGHGVLFMSWSFSQTIAVLNLHADDDAVGIFFSNNPPECLDNLSKVLMTFESNNQTITRCLDYATTFICTQADEQYVEIYSRDSNVGNLIYMAANKAALAILNTQWYIDHKNDLEWDSDRSLCYMLAPK